MEFRHELKHNINYSDYLSLRSRLKSVAKLDEHVGEDGTYFIRSLYFDNLYDKALREKIDGVNNREKFRIRFYNMDESRILLEKKSKMNGLCNKLSTKLTKEDTIHILEGNIDFLLASKEPLKLEFYAKLNNQLLKPKTIVDYVREPYVYNAGNVRITFDSNIRTGIYNKDFFSKDVPTVRADCDSPIILEVKYDNFLPELINMILQTPNRRASTYSKYASSRIYG